jgi:putative solute:sodium symporter small subunit
MPAASPDLDTARAADARARHWRRTQRLTAALLGVWFAVGFALPWFARDLEFTFFGWPFSFWVAAQGGAMVFVAILVVYARRMARIDRALAAAGGPAAPGAVEARQPR